jgi:cation diffusion facilitator family transporter
MKHQQIMAKSFYVNIFLVIVKIISGLVFNSVALIADGVHSISDLMSDIFVLLGIRHSIKPADEDHPFGHGKFEYVLSLFLGISIILIAYNLGKNVISSWQDTLQVPNSISLGVILFVVVAKLFLARYLIAKGKETGSEIIQASGQESFSDVLSSAVVFVGVLGVIIGNAYNITWMLKGDKVASLIIAVFIIRIGIIIILEAIKSIQGKSVKQEICQEYRQSIEVVDGVISVDHLDMIAYGPYYQAIVEIRVDGKKTVTEGHDIAEAVTAKLLENEKVCHVSVHVNPGGSK